MYIIIMNENHGYSTMRFLPRFYMIHVAGLIIILFSMSMYPAVSPGNEPENNGRKMLESCQVAVEYLDNNQASGDIESVKFCDDYLTGFRETENVKEIQMGEHYYRGYCFPYKGVTNGELARVLVDYLQANEEEQDLAANTAIRDAFVEGYPCRN